MPAAPAPAPAAAAICSQVALGPGAAAGANPSQLRNIALCSQLQEVHRCAAAELGYHRRACLLGCLSAGGIALMLSTATDAGCCCCRSLATLLPRLPAPAAAALTPSMEALQATAVDTGAAPATSSCCARH